MGIDYESKLIYGWTVDSVLLKEFLIKNKAGTCDGYYSDEEEAKTAPPTSIINKDDPKTFYMQCSCVFCWKDLKLPEGVYIEVSYPYYDCGPSEIKYFIKLNKHNEMTSKELLAISDETIAAGQKLANELNLSKNKEKGPTIFSVIHIF